MKIYFLGRLRATARRLLRATFPKLMHAYLYSRMIKYGRGRELEEYLLPAIVDRQRDAVDVGAYAGTYTLLLAKLVPTVYAFEPNVEMATMLRHAAPPNVRVSRKAVCDREGKSEFYVPSVKGNGQTCCGSLVSPRGCDSDARLVETTTLDTALANSDVGFIKIDVEGAEQSVLMGARQLIARCRPVILVEANNPEAVATLSAFFEPLKYVGFFVHAGKTSGLCEFRAEMQDPQLFEAGLARWQMRLLNNFFFAPSGAETELRAEMDRFLARETDLGRILI